MRAGPLLLLIAILPSFVYLDHWADYVGALVGEQAPAGEDTEGLGRLTHHSHCHFGPSTCSEQPAPTGVRVVPVLVELFEPEFPAILMEDAAFTLEEFVISLPTEPPRL